MSDLTRARALLAVCTSIGAGLAAASPSPAAPLSAAPRILLVTLLANLAARGLSRFVLGYPSQRGGVHPPRRLRVLGVGATVFAICCWEAFDVGASLQRPWPAELGHIALFAAAGAAMARWCRSSELSPLHLSAALALVSSSVAALSGGLSDAAGVLLRLPQDAAVLWAGWHVAAIRARSLPGTL